MLCASGFVDNVMFSRTGSDTEMQAWSVQCGALFTVTYQMALLIGIGRKPV